MPNLPNQDSICLGIVGLGYVGLPLAVEFGKQLPVIGYDSDVRRVEQIKAGQDATRELSSEDLSEARLLRLTSSPDGLKACNVMIIAVPTPVDDNRLPDLTSLMAATEAVASALMRGGVVIYESTVYPGVVDELCAPLLARLSGLTLNEDFFVGYSPERINPGDKQHRLPDIRKITAGSTPEAADFVDALYRRIIVAGTWKTASIRIAEAAKIVENTQRDVNIALMNEFALAFNRIGLDTTEVLEAAGTKWNFLPFRPGLVGGHCVGVDAWYFAHCAHRAGHTARLVQQAREINDSIARHVVGEVLRLMAYKSIALAGARILVLGFSFKEACPDMRNSQVHELVRELMRCNAQVDIHDPWVSAQRMQSDYGLSPLNCDPTAGSYDALVLAVAHPEYVAWGATRLHALGKPVHVLYDVKSVLPADESDGRL